MTTQTVRQEGLDKFYTKPNISKKCLEIIGNYYKWDEWDLVIEPSAGNGSFYTQIPISKKIGIDISPEHKDIIKQDFLTYTPPSQCKNILMVGNPPFGKISSLAINFFNHGSKWAKVIAFIVPRTFRRISVQNKLNHHFHLIYDEDIPKTPCSFNPSMLAKCCFQIWEKRTIVRPFVELSTVHSDWQYLKLGPKDTKGQPTVPEGADFAIRAYGGKCGEIVEFDFNSVCPKNCHWIKSNIDTHLLIQRFKQLDYSLSMNTARQNSIGKGEIVRLYNMNF